MIRSLAQEDIRYQPCFGGFIVDLLRKFGHQILNVETISTKVHLLPLVVFSLNDIQGNRRV